jgi:hypothetical protein
MRDGAPYHWPTSPRILLLGKTQVNDIRNKPFPAAIKEGPAGKKRFQPHYQAASLKGDKVVAHFIKADSGRLTGYAEVISVDPTAT